MPAKRKGLWRAAPGRGPYRRNRTKNRAPAGTSTRCGASGAITPRVDLAVTMGGQGTVQTAMAPGTPLVGFPLQPEQELNVVLAERLGMARRLPPREGGTPRTTEAVRDLLGELPRYRAAAQRAQAHYRGKDGPAECARVILERVGA